MKPELRVKFLKIDLKVNLSKGWDTAKHLNSTKSFRNYINVPECTRKCLLVEKKRHCYIKIIEQASHSLAKSHFLLLVVSATFRSHLAPAVIFP